MVASLKEFRKKWGLDDSVASEIAARIERERSSLGQEMDNSKKTAGKSKTEGGGTEYMLVSEFCFNRPEFKRYSDVTKFFDKLPSEAAPAGITKQRLLSSEGMDKRVALLDNMKSLKSSWSELEAMITSTTISGKRLYVGEGQRVNNLMWAMTLNGATDITQRTMIVELERPTYSAAWTYETLALVAEHAEEIIADILWTLQQPVSPSPQRPDGIGGKTK